MIGTIHIWIFHREAKEKVIYWMGFNDNQTCFVFVTATIGIFWIVWSIDISKLVRNGLIWFHGIQILLPYNSIIFISLGMHRKCWYLNIPQRSMSIPGKQKHHTDIDLDLMIIRFFLFVRFKTSPSLGIKWSMDISNIGKKDYLISSFYGVTWVYQGSKSTIAILHWI